MRDYIEDFTLTVAGLIEVIGVLVCFGGELCSRWELERKNGTRTNYVNGQP